MFTTRRTRIVRFVCSSSLALASLTGAQAFAQTRVRTPAMEQLPVSSDSRCGATDVEASVGRRIGLPAQDQSVYGGRRGRTPAVEQEGIITGGRRAGTPVQEQGVITGGRRAGTPAVEQQQSQATGGRRMGTPPAEQCSPYDAPRRVLASVPTQNPYGSTVQPLMIDAYGYEWAMAVTDPTDVPGFWSSYSCGDAVFVNDQGQVDNVWGWMDWETFSCVYLNVYWSY